MEFEEAIKQAKIHMDAFQTIKERMNYLNDYNNRKTELGVVEKYKVEGFYSSAAKDIKKLDCFYPEGFDITESLLNFSGGTHELTSIPVSSKVEHALRDVEFFKISSLKLKSL